MRRGAALAFAAAACATPAPLPARVPNAAERAPDTLFDLGDDGDEHGDRVLRLDRECAASGGSSGEPGTDAPSRSQAVSAMNGIAAAVVACRASRHGTLYLWLDAASDGSATRVRLMDRREHPFHPSVYECAAEVGCSVRFAPFRDPAFSLVYPFRI